MFWDIYLKSVPPVTLVTPYTPFFWLTFGFLLIMSPNLVVLPRAFCSPRGDIHFKKALSRMEKPVLHGRGSYKM